MTLTDRIELNPKICNGRPVIKETRIPVSVILEQIAEGESCERMGVRLRLLWLLGGKVLKMRTWGQASLIVVLGEWCL